MRIIWIVLLANSAIQAASVEVDIHEGYFSPEVVEIEPGDTVRWTNREGVHNVAATDNSFDSGDPLGGNWTYSHTFTAEGQIHYVSENDPAMQGAVVVEQKRFSINYGLTGSWWNPAMNGQGLMIEILPDENALVAYWFTYDNNGQRQWMLGSGVIGDSNQVSLDFIRPAGGKPMDAQAPEKPQWGTGSLDFQDCYNARFTWSGMDGQGQMDLERLTADVLCETGGLEP